MRCREVEALWDDVRDGDVPLREAVLGHLRACPPCQDLYEQYEGVAYCLSCLPDPEPSCNLAKKIVEHIAHQTPPRRTDHAYGRGHAYRPRARGIQRCTHRVHRPGSRGTARRGAHRVEQFP